MWDEAGLRFPAVRDRRATIQGPLPVGPAVQRLGQSPDFGLLFRVPVEVGGASEHPGEKERRVDSREFALPNPASALHVQEVVIEAFVPGGIGLRAVRAVVKEAQPPQSDFRGELAGDHAAFDEHRDGRQTESDGGDTAWRRGVGLITDETVGWVGLMEVVLEGSQPEADPDPRRSAADFRIKQRIHSLISQRHRSAASSQAASPSPRSSAGPRAACPSSTRSMAPAERTARRVSGGEHRGRSGCGCRQSRGKWLSRSGR